ncbi:hypothetical protein T484DRAFT_1910816 [Baffinella frigidus]|nr:hypothetical protein T484DRAFT_1910816 [Cryptophyta sp. CCMP2293]
MLVPVLSGMPRTTLLRVEVSTVNVGGIKEEIQRQWNIPVTLQRIVCSGRVLEDGAQDLPQLCLEGSEPLWLVRCTEGEDEPASVLASLFPSTGAAPSTQQDQEDAAIDILERFCLSVIDDGTGELVWRLTKEERSALDFTRASLRSQAAFFTSYACVLLWDESNVDWATMRLRSLDEHAFAVHSGTAGRFHSSRVGAARVLPVGTVPIGKLKEVLRRSQELIQDVRAECGGEDQRIGWKGKRGHQRTPAFISSIFADVLRTLGTDDASWLTAAKQTPTMPRGGFTDVGMHSDSKHRDTTWPVVEAVVQDRLEAAGQPKLFALAMAQLRLWAAEHAVARCCAGAGGGGELDAVMLMLRDAVERGGAISDAEQHDMAFFDARCAVVRHEMERASRQAAERAAAARHLPPQLALSDFVVRNPTLSPPPAVEAPCTGDGLDQRLAREAANIGWLPAPLADAASWREAEGWLARPQLRDAIARGEATGVQLALANVERLVYTRTELLEAGRGGEVDESEVLALESLVETYRLAQRGFVGSASGGARMQAELRSRETLVVWAAFCLVHQATQGGFPLLGDFGVALDPRDLRHLVLADKLAVDALLRCAAYLHTAGWDVKPCVFSLRAGDGTLDLARQSAEACPEMVRLWEEEVAAASERRERHWVEVQRKKKRIAVLRSEIPPLETRARAADNDGRDFLNAYSAVVAANQLAAGLRLQIVRNEAEITREKTPPPAVLQPLPAERSKAMAVIFFLKMPRRFQALSRLSFMAQQMLVPGVAKIVIPAVDQGGAVAEQSVDIDAPIKRDAPATAWETYYTCGSSGVGRTAQSPLVRLGAMEQVPKQIGGKDVTKVWHPDDFNARLFWEGGARGAFTLDRRAGGTAFDPFTPLPVSAVVRWFTETLPADRSALQWAMGAPYGASRTRGNDALAFQAFRPPWLWPSEFRAMGALRAAARQQLRTLCVTLHERALPLDDPAVRALMLQTLFHVGELEHDERAPAGSLPRLAWRGDVDTCDGWAALHGELAMLAEELREKPGDHATLLLLAQVASYGGQWHAGCREAARSLGAVASAWADALGDKVDVTSEAELPTLRAKRCLFYMYAVVCHSAGELREEDAAALCEAVVLADYLRISEVETVYDAAVSALTVVTRGIMAARMPEVLLLVKRGTSVLTAAVRRVLVSQTPAALPWIGLEAGAEPSAGCFHAVVAAHVFSVNLLSGTVLYDGLPPSRLPRSIFEDAAYTRSFGARNFEVVLENGVFYTVRRVFGCKYQFFTAGGRLVIREVDPERGIELELLHGTPAGAWGQQLPERLRTMHSHWYCREAGVVMLRPIPFHERSVHFVLVHAGEAAGSDSDSSYVEVSPRSGGAGPHVVDRAGTGEWLCCRVPLHLQKVHWLDQRRDASSRELDQLVLLADGHAASLLRTFEPGESLLHVYLKAAPDGPLGDVGEGVTLSVEYPRFDLSFDLERGQLRCKSSFLGTRLARCQLLPDVLIGFEQ